MIKCDICGKEINVKTMIFIEGFGTFIRVCSDHESEATDKIEELKTKHKLLLDNYKKAIKQDLEKFKLDKLKDFKED